jgi:hypothetical protein
MIECRILMSIGSTVCKRCAVMALSFCLWIVSGVSGQVVHFMYGEPGSDMPNKRPYPLIIYSFHEPDRLDSVWSLGTNVKAENISMYGSAGLVAISVGPRPPLALNLLTMGDLREVGRMDFEGFGIVSHYYYFAEPIGLGQMELLYLAPGADYSTPFRTKRFSVRGKVKAGTAASVSPSGELRLAGVAGEYGGGGSDVLSFRSVNDSNPQAVMLNVTFDGFPVPDSLITMKNSYGWVMIANEPQFRALMSVPERNGLTEREILVFHRASGQWSSLLVPVHD